MSNSLKSIYRILIAITLSVILASLGIHGSTGVLQSLFTVLGIAFSIAMSLIVSFDLSKIYNTTIKGRIRASIKRTRNSIIYDFSTSTIALIIASTDKLSGREYNILIPQIHINFDLCAICIIAVSLIYEVYNFTNIQSLNEEITDRVMEEETARK